jgi:hypothetical protein
MQGDDGCQIVQSSRCDLGIMIACCSRGPKLCRSLGNRDCDSFIFALSLVPMVNIGGGHRIAFWKFMKRKWFVEQPGISP